MLRKKRSDRNHVLYKITCVDTGDSYVGLTVSQGRAFLKSVKVRWQKHVSRAKRENKEWLLYEFFYFSSLVIKNRSETLSLRE